MTSTNITAAHNRALAALTSGAYENFALFSGCVDAMPASAIAAVSVNPPAGDGGEAEYLVHPGFVSGTDSMRLTAHAGRPA